MRAVLAARQENDPRCGRSLKWSIQEGSASSTLVGQPFLVYPELRRGAVRGMAHATIKPDTYLAKVGTVDLAKSSRINTYAVSHKFIIPKGTLSPLE